MYGLQKHSTEFLNWAIFPDRILAVKAPPRICQQSGLGSPYIYTAAGHRLI